MTASLIVQPSQIQKELDSLWNSLENKNKMRASLFNLIFYSKDRPRDEYIRKVAESIIEKFPARIFFIVSRESQEIEPVKTAISIITAEQGEYDITCDFIEISTNVVCEHQVPLILMPHIIPDLPIFLVWADDPVKESPLRRKLEELATRVIFDSETAQDLTNFSSAILHIQKGSRCEIADLNWARLESWRDLLVAVFSSSDQAETLYNLRHCKITYNAQPTPFFCHTKIQSIYLQAWLCCRLGWKLWSYQLRDDSIEFEYKNPQEESVFVVIEAKKQTALPPGLIMSLELVGAHEDRFFFDRSLSSTNTITCEYRLNHPSNLPTKFLIARGASGQSLFKEICHKGTSEHFLEVINFLSRMEPMSLC